MKNKNQPAAMVMCPARIERYWTLMGKAPAVIGAFTTNPNACFNRRNQA
jgi:hypothetical protein